MHGVRLKGLKDGVQIAREVVLFEVIVRARRHDVPHQLSDLPEFVVHDVPLFLMLRHHLLTH
jgi:hypothetical protein